MTDDLENIDLRTSRSSTALVIVGLLFAVGAAALAAWFFKIMIGPAVWTGC
jgi:hypothetical protein